MTTFIDKMKVFGIVVFMSLIRDLTKGDVSFQSLAINVIAWFLVYTLIDYTFVSKSKLEAKKE